MRIGLGIHSLANTGGIESYATTVGDHLQRTGHDVQIIAGEDGISADVARELGLRVSIGFERTQGEFDAFVVQDAIASHGLLGAQPQVPQIFRWNSEQFDVVVPPQIDDLIKLIVVVHEDAYRRVRSLAVKPPVVQLAHPVDTVRFRPLNELHERPRRVVAMSNTLSGETALRLETACEIAGLELRRVGQHGEGITGEPEIALNDGDIVVARGKTAVEGMACGRAVYVYDVYGSDGWITEHNYPDKAANCFAGQTNPRELSAETLAEDLLGYDAAMGPVNRALASRNHSAMDHVGRLVEAIEQVLEAPGRVMPNDNAFEMERLARMSWRHESRAFGLATLLREQSLELGEAREAAQKLSRQLQEEHDRAEGLHSSGRWKAVNLLLRPYDRWRAR